uniref:Reverse transcriptase domain-containing protein n=1 Tax=Anopheles stephensi TaxID=30069 RepID=A0A182YSL8_ANOST
MFYVSDLLDVILRFRSYPVALVGDIQSSLRTHPVSFFASNTSPHLRSQYGHVRSHAIIVPSYTHFALTSDEGSDYSPACSALKRNFYVDDFIGGADTVEDGLLLRKKLAGVLAKGRFELRKWASNRLDVLSGLRADQIGTQSLYQFIPNATVKTLGVCWKPESDELCFEPNVRDEPTALTRRSILSCIAK